MENDHLLLMRVAEGDETAFKLLFERHRLKLYNYLLKITKSRNTTEELVIDVFVKLWTRRTLLPEVKNFDAFLHKVAYNKALDFFRIASRNKILQHTIANHLEIAHDSSADKYMLSKEYNEIFYKALNELSPQRKMVFAMSRIQGLTHEQIACNLRLSRNTVRNTIAETLKHVRRFLHEHEIETFLN